MPGLILLAGYTRSGKDTVGAMLAEEAGMRRFAFADKLKRAARALGIWSGREEEKREPCVLLGRVLREEVYGEIWIDALLLDGALQEAAQTTGAYITDVRYANELFRCRQVALDNNLWCECWWVERPGVGPAGEEEAEKTTILRQLSDHKLLNDGTLEDLFGKVRARYTDFERRGDEWTLRQTERLRGVPAA